MINRSMSGLAYIPVVLWLTLYWPVITLATQGSKDKQVAGHRVLKLYDDNNCGAKVNGADSIFQDREGRYWIATFRGLYLFDEERNIWKHFTKETGELVANSIEAIGQSSDGKMWFTPPQYIATTGTSVSWFDGESWQKLEKGFHHPHLTRRISGMFVGQDGRLWLALKHELVSYDGQNWSAPLNLPELIERWKAPSPQQVAAAASNIKDKQELHRLFAAETRYEIYCGLQDKDGYIWLGTPAGIVRYDEGKRKWTTYPHIDAGIVARIYEDRKGRIWFADKREKVHLYDKQKNNWTSYNLRKYLPPDDEDRLVYLHDMYQDRAGLMMFATIKGLIVFDERESKWEVLTNQNSDLPDDKIYIILENKAGNIWIGTTKGILVLE